MTSYTLEIGKWYVESLCMESHAEYLAHYLLKATLNPIFISDINFIMRKVAQNQEVLDDHITPIMAVGCVPNCLYWYGTRVRSKSDYPDIVGVN